jgi:hypothetical protein
VLHHPEYCARHAESLKREFARIPLVGDGTGVPFMARPFMVNRPVAHTARMAVPRLP